MPEDPKIPLSSLRAFARLATVSALSQIAPHKVVRLSAIFVLILLWLGVGYHLHYDRNQTLKASSEQAQNFSMAFAEHVSGTMATFDTLLRAIVRDYRRDPQNFDPVTSLAENSPNKSAAFQITIIGSDGYMLTNNFQGQEKNEPKLYLGDREHFLFHVKNPDAGLYISKPIVGRVSKRLTLQMARGIYSDSGIFMGVAVLSIDPQYLSTFFKSINLGTLGSVTVVGRDMVIRARATGRGDTSIGQDLSNSPLNDALKAAPTGQFVNKAKVDGIERIYYYISLPDYPLIVNVGIAVDEILAPHRSRLYFIIGIAVLVSFIVIIATYYVLRQMKNHYRLAYVDKLTGLPNRARLQKRMAQARRAGRFGVLLVDLDRFGAINFALGHMNGDQLLKLVAERLREALPERYEIFRLWGDEFAIFCPSDQLDDLDALAIKISDVMSAPVTLKGQKIDVFGRMGIGLWPDDGKNIDDLTQKIGIAVREAKRTFVPYVWASAIRMQPPTDQLHLLGELREAITKSELQLYYQPKFDVTSCTVTGAEALLRWFHPTKGQISPAGFIPFAEASGFIRELTPWLIREAAFSASVWRAAGYPLTVSVNVSVQDLAGNQLQEAVSSALKDTGIPASSLCLEITESALMNDPQSALLTLRALSDMGIKLSIDDYGAGHASLSYLKLLPVHELKIDMSLVESVGASEKDSEIVRSTINLGHALGLAVVGEGVETEEQRRWLSENGCDNLQGFLISRAIDGDRFLSWLQERQRPMPPTSYPEANVTMLRR